MEQEQEELQKNKARTIPGRGGQMELVYTPSLSDHPFMPFQSLAWLRNTVLRFCSVLRFLAFFEGKESQQAPPFRQLDEKVI